MKISKEQVKALANRAYKKVVAEWTTARNKYVEDNRSTITPQIERVIKLLEANPDIWTMRCKVIDTLCLSFERGTTAEKVVDNYEVTRYFQDRFSSQYPAFSLNDIENEIMIATIKVENLESLQKIVDTKFSIDYDTFNMDYTTKY